MIRPDTYEELLEIDPELKGKFTESQWRFMRMNNDSLRKAFGDLWKKNLRRNCKRLFKKHGTVSMDLYGIGADRAIIAIGAGPSFNKNKDVLYEIYAANMGASADLTSVSPVFPSLPMTGTPLFSASSTMAGISAPLEGVKLMYGHPS